MSSNKGNVEKSKESDLQNDDAPAPLQRQNAFIYKLPTELQNETTNSVITDKKTDNSEVTTDKKPDKSEVTTDKKVK